MSGSDQFMLDRAYWDPAIYQAAANAKAAGLNVTAINVYAWDHYLRDVNGYCGGFTPAVVADIYAHGYDVHFTFCFRDGEAPLDPAACVGILSVLGAKVGAWVHNDIESGAMDSLTHDLAFTQGVQASGFRSAPYGLASTLSMGYLQGAQGEWVASYQFPWSQPPPLTNVPNTGTPETYAGWQYSTNSPPPLTVDVSVHNFPPAQKEEPLTPQDIQAVVAAVMGHPDMRQLVWRIAVLYGNEDATPSTPLDQGGPAIPIEPNKLKDALGAAQPHGSITITGSGTF